MSNKVKRSPFENRIFILPAFQTPFHSICTDFPRQKKDDPSDRRRIVKTRRILTKEKEKTERKEGEKNKTTQTGAI